MRLVQKLRHGSTKYDLLSRISRRSPSTDCIMRTDLARRHTYIHTEYTTTSIIRFTSTSTSDTLTQHIHITTIGAIHPRPSNGADSRSHHIIITDLWLSPRPSARPIQQGSEMWIVSLKHRRRGDWHCWNLWCSRSRLLSKLGCFSEICVDVIVVAD